MHPKLSRSFKAKMGLFLYFSTVLLFFFATDFFMEICLIALIPLAIVCSIFVYVLFYGLYFSHMSLYVLCHSWQFSLGFGGILGICMITAWTLGSWSGLRLSSNSSSRWLATGMACSFLFVTGGYLAGLVL